MPFVKLDVEITRSSLWVDRDGRSLFITMLLEAEPFELTEPTEALDVREMKYTGFVIPPGWYGLVRSSGSSICRLDGVALEEGLCILERLSGPDHDSRSRAFDGRRVARVDGGYLILNYMTYRDRDHTSAERSKRLRERRKKQREEQAQGKNGAGSSSDDDSATRDDVTSRRDASRIAEGKETECIASTSSDDRERVVGIGELRRTIVFARASHAVALDKVLARAPEPSTWAGEIVARLDGMHGKILTVDTLGDQLEEFVANGGLDRPNFRHFKAYLSNPGTESNGNGSHNGNGRGRRKTAGEETFESARDAFADLDQKSHDKGGR